MALSMAKRWLFKAEPEVYGIEHLAAEPHQTGRWDGIRNYQARNFLRDQITLGDELLLYHSHCKRPGVVGTARVVKTAYPDPTQFNPDSPYFDVKATPENPRWVSVDIQLQEVFSPGIPLTVIKQQPSLATMTLLRQARLSIQPVSASEWKALHALQRKLKIAE